jgi:hypothetical protein
MADRITNIEEQLVVTIQTIDKSTQPTGYTFYTKTGTVQLYDEVLSLSTNKHTSTSASPTNYKSVNHVIEQQESTGIEGQEWTTGQWAYTNRVVYVIESKVHNVGSESTSKESPKNAIRKRMNECLNDLLFAFGKNYTLNGKVAWIKFLGAFRDYEDVTNNRIQSGKLISQWEVVFTQSFNNPNLPACI